MRYLLYIVPAILCAFFVATMTLAQGTGTINQLDQWRRTATGQITQNIPNSILRLTGYESSGSCLVTDAQGNVSTSTCGTGGSGTPGGGNGQLQFNNGGSFGGTSTPSVTAINATSTTATSTLPNIIMQKIQSLTSAGLTFFSNGGTPIADFGAGGGSNASFFGGVNIDGQTRIASNLTGVIRADNGVLSTTSVASGTVYLASTSPWTVGNLARVASNGAVDSVATSSLGLTFLSLTDTPASFTAGRVPFTNSAATALTDSANLVFDGVDLGIGTATPGWPLSVAGQSGLTGQVNLLGTNANIALGSNWLSGDGGDEGVFVGSTGNIGIGTSTPGRTLSVVSSGEGTISLYNSFGVGNGVSIGIEDFQFLRFGGTSAFKPQFLVVGDAFADPGRLVQRFGAGGIRFESTDGAANTERMRLTQSGFLGIGTTSPSARLTVTGDMRLTGAFADSSSSTGAVGSVLTATATGTQWVSTSTLGFIGGGSGTVYLATSTGFTTGQVAFATGAGTVGSTPTTTLTETVNGLELSGTPIVLGATPLQIALTSGFTIPSTTLVTSASSFFASPSSLCTAITGSAALCDGSDDGAGGSFTVGPTSTPMWRSTLQGWTFPDGSLVNTDIQANRFHTIKPIWYEVTATGSLFLRTASSTQPFGFNATNTEIIKENSIEQFVTVSGNDPEIHTLTASSTLVENSITTLIAFATSTGFTGIELDWEGFGDWTAGETQDYINYVNLLSVRAHQYGLKTMIYLPPIWNSVANGESGSGDEWDTAVSENYYELEYEDFENVPVDYLLIAVYDYQFDYGAGRPNAPLKWQDEIISYAKRKISDHDRLIIGLPGAGYGGATGGFSFTAYTYASATAITGFSGATRDTESWELTWTNGGNSYFICDDECINVKRLRAEENGIDRVSIWHIGGNRYGSGKIEPTVHASPHTTLQDMLVGERWRISCSHIVGATQIVADGLTGCEGISFYEDGADGTLTATAGNGYSYGRVAVGAATNNGVGVFINGASAGWIRIASTTSSFSAIARQSNGTLYGTSTALYIGYTNLATAGTVYETAPTAGCYLTSSSTQANVIAVSANGGARTNTNTGIASSTSNSAGQFYEYKVVPYPTGCRFLMRTSQTGTLQEVAYHSTNLPTVDLNAGIHISRGAATLAPSFDVLSIDYEAAILLPRN